MKNVVIVGANGRSVRQIIPRLVEQVDVDLKLFARRPQRLDDVATESMALVDGDAHDQEAVRAALTGQDIVIVALGDSELARTPATVIRAAEETGVRRIIAINAGGIYDELPEPFNTWDFECAGKTRPRNLRAAKVVEQSSLHHMLLRPVLLTNEGATEVQLTRKGEAYKGTETSRASLGAFIVGLVAVPRLICRGEPRHHPAGNRWGRARRVSMMGWSTASRRRANKTR